MRKSKRLSVSAQLINLQRLYDGLVRNSDKLSIRAKALEERNSNLSSTIEELKVLLFNKTLEAERLQGTIDRVRHEDRERSPVIEMPKAPILHGDYAPLETTPPAVILKMDLGNQTSSELTSIYDGGFNRTERKPKHWVNK